MRNAHRPMGRFFCLQLVMAAAAFVLLAERTHAAPPVSGPALTQVAETVYRADGTVAKGTVLISWPAFTTVDGKAVAAGSLRVPLGNGGAFAASLAPNTGAQPAGVYYRVVYQLAGPQLSPTLWYVNDPNGSVSVGGGQLQLSGGPATVALVEKIELAGGLRIQHGQITFGAPSSGTLGGIYNGSIADGNCVAGFRIAPSGGNCAIQALVNGSGVGAVISTQPGHQYALATQLFANEAHRVQQTYCSSAHGSGSGRGGDSIAAGMRVVLSVHDVDPNNPGTLALPATLLFDDVLGAAPPFANYAVADGPNLHAQVRSRGCNGWQMPKYAA